MLFTAKFMIADCTSHVKNSWDKHEKTLPQGKAFYNRNRDAFIPMAGKTHANKKSGAFRHFFCSLLDFDDSADFGKLGLDLLGFVLGSAFLDGLGGGFHQILGFLQA